MIRVTDVKSIYATRAERYSLGCSSTAGAIAAWPPQHGEGNDANMEAGHTADDDRAALVALRTRQKRSGERGRDQCWSERDARSGLPTDPGNPRAVGAGCGSAGFPTVMKAGMGVGGEYGEACIRIGGKTAGYYNTISASVGLQLGAQARSVVIMFMTGDALANFRRLDGWKVGVDGSIAIITVGAGGSIDSTKSPIPSSGSSSTTRVSCTT